MKTLNKLFDYIGIKNDKVKHFLIGAVLAFILTFFLSNIWVLAIVAVLGIGKELYDLISKRGTAEAADAFVTLSGAVLVMFAVQFLNDFNYGWLFAISFVGIALIAHFLQKILK